MIDESGQPVEGISVGLAGSCQAAGQYGQRTNAQGEYSLIANANASCLAMFEDRYGLSRPIPGDTSNIEFVREPGTYAPHTTESFAVEPLVVTEIPDVVMTTEGRKEVTNVPTPAIIGTPQVGGRIVALAQPWIPGMRMSYYWYRDGQRITHWMDSADSITLAPEDAGRQITVAVHGYSRGYAYSKSAQSAPVIPPMLEFSATPVPSISGTPKVGSTLTVVPGTWTAKPSKLAYQWYRSESAIQGAVNRTYKLTADDIGEKITVRVVGSRVGYVAATQYSAATPPIVANPSIKAEGDIVAIDSQGRLWNYGQGAVRTLIGSSGWTVMDEIHTVDWNTDGYIDIIAKTHKGQLYYYKAQPAGGFTRYTIGSGGWAPYDLTVAKWNSTGKNPVLIAKHSKTGQLFVYGNKAGYKLSPRNVLGSSGWGNYTLTAMDWDKDGRKDLVARTPEGQLKLYRGDASGTFIRESRKVIGRSGWNAMSNIVSSNGFGGANTSGLLAKDNAGKLWYYQSGKNAFATRRLVGTGWTSFLVAGQ